MSPLMQSNRFQTNVKALLFVCLATLMISQAPASASTGKLPKLYCNVVSHNKEKSFSPVFSIRPKVVIVNSADGGELVVHWTQWTKSSATGAGTAHPDHGSFPITIRASDPVHGRFMHLTITTETNGKTEVDHLHLTKVVGTALGWERQ
jgi:hypothetical protein